MVRKNSYDVILADYKLPNWNGMESVEILRREGLDIPVIVVTGSLGELTAVECIKQGAADYVLKDHLARLPESVRRAIREKRLREENRRGQDELARSNRDLEQFAYVASHDLQEPLRMVAIYTQLLAERYRGKLDADADKYIHYAVDGALRMQALVRDLLAFSRVGRQGIDFEKTDCNAVMETVLKNLQAAIEESGARVVYENLPTVMADSSQLMQVLQNLIGNGIKFRGAEPPVIQIASETGRTGLAVLGRRQRNRHRRRACGNHLCHLQALAYSDGVPRQRNWPVHLQENHRVPRRPHLGRIRTRTRLHVPIHPPSSSISEEIRSCR